MLENLPSVLHSAEQFWTKQNDRAEMYLIYPEADFSYKSVAKNWMAPAITKGWSNWQQELVIGQALEHVATTGDWSRIDESIDLLASYAEHTGHLAEGYSFLLPGFGPGCVAAGVSGHSEFKDSTIWLEPPQPWELERIAAVTTDQLSPWWDLMLETTRRLCARLQDRYVIAMPDIGWPMDLLSSLHGNEDLCYDLIDEPELVESARDTMHDILYYCYDQLDAIIRPGNHGASTECMRWISAKPMRVSGCDFSALISPAMFERFVLPEINYECERFDKRVVFHLDGPGELPHVDHLLQTGLHGIQWVTGAGNPGGTDPCWDEFYTKIIDAGKRIYVGGGSPEKLQALFKRFPSRYFHISSACGSRAAAEEMLRVRDAAVGASHA